MSRAWMPLYIADYLADTAHLAPAEHGAYLLLIMHYWQHGGLPSEDKHLARIARMSPEEWAEARPSIASFFADGWVHQRIQKELATAAEKYEKRAKSGRKGGNASAKVRQTPTKTPSNASSNATSGAAAGLNQPQSPREERKKEENGEGMLGRPVEISPLDPVLADPDNPLAYYSEPELALAVITHGPDAEDRIRELWRWTDSVGVTDINQKKRMIAGRMAKDTKALEQAPALREQMENPPAIAITSALASSRLAQRQSMRRSA